MLAKQRARDFEALRGSVRGRELFWSDARCARGSVRGEEPWKLLDGARELERRALRARLCSRQGAWELLDSGSRAVGAAALTWLVGLPCSS